MALETNDTAKILRPSRPVRNKFLESQDDKVGVQLGKLLDTRIPVYEQERFERQELVAQDSVSSAAAGSPATFTVQPADDEVILISYLIVRCTQYATDMLGVFNTTVNGGGGAIAIPWTRFNNSAVDGGPTPFILPQAQVMKYNATNLFAQVGGPVVLTGTDFKPAGHISDTFVVTTIDNTVAGDSFKLSYLAKRIPPPSLWINGGNRITMSAP